MENYLNTLVRYRRSVQQQDAESWYDDSSEEYVPDTQTFDYIYDVRIAVSLL